MHQQIKKIVFDGWIKRQLEQQRAGLFGHLHEVWKDVRDSKWFGGKEEGWERFPYYLNGLIPLAYALNDQDLIVKVEKYVDILINAQDERGRIAPHDDTDAQANDIWSLFLVLKVLTIYAELSKSDKADETIKQTLIFINQDIQKNTIINWGHSRYFECFIPILYLLRKGVVTKEFATSLTIKLKAQGLDYVEASKLWHESRTSWSYDQHGVNIAMALKADALYQAIMGTHDSHEAKYLLTILEKYHGNAYGFFNADECLAPKSPNHGTELCAVVEAMYSYELLFSFTRDTYYLDKLEELAFNALAATISDDMWAHQYDQQVNQIACYPVSGKVIFTTNSNEANVFGLEPHYGCCTANFGQGWPLFALRAVSIKADILHIDIPLSFKVTLEDNTSIICTSEYPFRKDIKLVANKDVKIKVRVPRFAVVDSALAVAEGYITLNLTKDKEFKLKLEYAPRLVKRDNGFGVVKYGPLLFALPVPYEAEIVEYTKNGVERKYPYCDYYYKPKDETRYGFNGTTFKVIEKDYNLPFSRQKPPLLIEATFAKLQWNNKEGYAHLPEDNYQKVLEKGLKLTLVPYGATYLRMTEMPIIKEK